MSLLCSVTFVIPMQTHMTITLYIHPQSCFKLCSVTFVISLFKLTWPSPSTFILRHVSNYAESSLWFLHANSHNGHLLLWPYIIPCFPTMQVLYKRRTQPGEMNKERGQEKYAEFLHMKRVGPSFDSRHGLLSPCVGNVSRGGGRGEGGGEGMWDGGRGPWEGGSWHISRIV